jgi:Protein of unknown function (DUF3237)
MIDLEHVLTYRFSIRGPLSSTEGSPLGTRHYWEMSEGTLTGPGLSAFIAMPGGDWYRASPDGFGRPDVRVQLETDDGALILMHYTGLVEQTDAFVDAAARNAPTGSDDQYMRFAVSFDTGAERYHWLNQSLFVARGHILGTTELEYEIYRVA